MNTYDSGVSGVTASSTSTGGRTISVVGPSPRSTSANPTPASAAATQTRDLHWLQANLPADAHVCVTDQTSAYAVLGVMGPNARRLLQLTVAASDQAEQTLDMLLAKKRSRDRREWLEAKGDLAEV